MEEQKLARWSCILEEISQGFLGHEQGMSSRLNQYLEEFLDEWASEIHQNEVNSFLSRMGFPSLPSFSGVNPVHWINGIEVYFDVYPSMNIYQFSLVEDLLVGRAKEWVVSWSFDGSYDDYWNKFVDALCDRFENDDYEKVDESVGCESNEEKHVVVDKDSAVDVVLLVEPKCCNLVEFFCEIRKENQVGLLENSVLGCEMKNQGVVVEESSLKSEDQVLKCYYGPQDCDRFDVKSKPPDDSETTKELEQRIQEFSVGTEWRLVFRNWDPGDIDVPLEGQTNVELSMCKRLSLMLSSWFPGVFAIANRNRDIRLVREGISVKARLLHKQEVAPPWFSNNHAFVIGNMKWRTKLFVTVVSFGRSFDVHLKDCMDMDLESEVRELVVQNNVVEAVEVRSISSLVAYLDLDPFDVKSKSPDDYLTTKMVGVDIPGKGNFEDANDAADGKIFFAVDFSDKCAYVVVVRMLIDGDDRILSLLKEFVWKTWPKWRFKKVCSCFPIHVVESEKALNLNISVIVFKEIQRFASIFLPGCIFFAVERVGSNTDLIIQRVKDILEADKRNHLMDLLHAQRDLVKPTLSLVLVENKQGARSLEQWLYVLSLDIGHTASNMVEFGVAVVNEVCHGLRTQVWYVWLRLRFRKQFWQVWPRWRSKKWLEDSRMVHSIDGSASAGVRGYSWPSCGLTSQARNVEELELDLREKSREAYIVDSEIVERIGNPSNVSANSEILSKVIEVGVFDGSFRINMIVVSEVQLAADVDNMESDNADTKLAEIMAQFQELLKDANDVGIVPCKYDPALLSAHVHQFLAEIKDLSLPRPVTISNANSNKGQASYLVSPKAFYNGKLAFQSTYLQDIMRGMECSLFCSGSFIISDSSDYNDCIVDEVENEPQIAIGIFLVIYYWFPFDSCD